MLCAALASTLSVAASIGLRAYGPTRKPTDGDDPRRCPPAVQRPWRAVAGLPPVARGAGGRWRPLARLVAVRLAVGSATAATETDARAATSVRAQHAEQPVRFTI